jgi:hypothetical protein
MRLSMAQPKQQQPHCRCNDLLVSVLLQCSSHGSSMNNRALLDWFALRVLKATAATHRSWRQPINTGATAAAAAAAAGATAAAPFTAAATRPDRTSLLLHCNPAMQNDSSSTPALPAALTAAFGCLLLLLLLLATAAATCCCCCRLLLPPAAAACCCCCCCSLLHSVLASSHLDESRQVSHWQQQRIDIVDYAAANFHIMRRDNLRLRGCHLLFGVAGVWHLCC